MLNKEEIKEIIPQRDPFLMIDEVEEYIPGESATAYKNVDINEWYFKGHFPGNPIMPGVLIIEACAQLCSIVFESDGTDPNSIYVLLKVDGFKFLRPAIPGDVLHIYVTKTKVIGDSANFDCKVLVDGNVFSKGSLMFTKIQKDSIYKR